VRHPAEREAATETAPTDLTTVSQVRPSGGPLSPTVMLIPCWLRLPPDDPRPFLSLRSGILSGGATQLMRTNLAAIRTALEAAGVEFIPENGGGAGVRLRKG
jgi:hypothetical protein